jgi:DNA-binding protein H-NS
MKSTELKALSIDELWNSHERVVSELGRKIEAEKASLEERLRRLGNVSLAANDRIKPAKRRYPKVAPKYRNPKNPEETGAGRGKQPHWLRAQLRSGKRLEDFEIKEP